MRNNQVLSKLIQSKLLITIPAFQAELYRLSANDSFGDEDLKYAEITEQLSKKLSGENVTVTTKFSDTNIDEGSIALHRIEGSIFYEYDYWGWCFSTKQFIDDLHAADANQNIDGHFFFINSGGGAAYYLDAAAEVIKTLNKPVVAYIEDLCCSAAYYLACYADKIYANTPFDTIGSIGTMVAFWDIKPYFEELGLKYHEHYATPSKLKNKKYNDLLENKPERFIKEELDPLATEFIRTVKNARPGTSDSPEAVFQGETFYTPEAIKHGLIDGQLHMEEAVQELLKLIDDHNTTTSSRQNMLNLIK